MSVAATLSLIRARLALLFHGVRDLLRVGVSVVEVAVPKFLADHDPQPPAHVIVRFRRVLFIQHDELHLLIARACVFWCVCV